MRPRDLVYDRLKQRILVNALAPETALTELGLAQELGASQGTVREALLRLQEDGLVTRSGHRGTTVTPLDAEAAIEILALRRQIEQRGALRAAARIDAAGLAALADLQRRMDGAAAAGEAYRLIELDVAFHMTIFRAAGLGALEPILNRCMLHTHRHKLWAPRHSRPLAETAARHRPILAALKQGGEALAAALGQHLDTIVDLAPERIAS